MKRAIWFGLGLALCAAPALAENTFHRWTGPLPELVEQNLPADIPARDVLVQDGCFFYVFGGKVYQLLQQSGGAKGLPVCIG